jgi:hypothetical protein
MALIASQKFGGHDSLLRGFAARKEEMSKGDAIKA